MTLGILDIGHILVRESKSLDLFYRRRTSGQPCNFDLIAEWEQGDEMRSEAAAAVDRVGVLGSVIACHSTLTTMKARPTKRAGSRAESFAGSY